MHISSADTVTHMAAYTTMFSVIVRMKPVPCYQELKSVRDTRS